MLTPSHVWLRLPSGAVPSERDGTSIVCKTTETEPPALLAQAQPGLLVCSFSRDGTHIAAGANDCHSYVWHWDLWPASTSPSGSRGAYGAASLQDERSREARWAAAAAGAAWPQPREVCQLPGHRHDVLLLQFSHDGQSIATGSKDGSVRVCCIQLPSATSAIACFAACHEEGYNAHCKQRQCPPCATAEFSIGRCNACVTVC